MPIVVIMRNCYNANNLVVTMSFLPAIANANNLVVSVSYLPAFGNANHLVVTVSSLHLYNKKPLKKK